VKATTKRKETREVEDYKYTCDKCGKPCGRDEEVGSYDVSDVTIEYETGTNFPGSRNTCTTVIDCCSACFKAHVLPALKNIGFTPRTEETDW